MPISLNAPLIEPSGHKRQMRPEGPFNGFNEIGMFKYLNNTHGYLYESNLLT